MLKEGFDMRSDEGMEELEEVQQELKQKDEERERSAGDVESGPVRASDKIRKCISCWPYHDDQFHNVFQLFFLHDR